MKTHAVNELLYMRVKGTPTLIPWFPVLGFVAMVEITPYILVFSMRHIPYPIGKLPPQMSCSEFYVNIAVSCNH